MDVFELGLESFESLSNIKNFTVSIGIKPVLVFLGDEFETVHTLKCLKNLFIDLFHQQETDVAHLSNIEYVITFACVDNKILLRTYR